MKQKSEFDFYLKTIGSLPISKRLFSLFSALWVLDIKTIITSLE